jgi:hypothetical protein
VDSPKDGVENGLQADAENRTGSHPVELDTGEGTVDKEDKCTEEETDKCSKEQTV